MLIDYTNTNDYLVWERKVLKIARIKYEFDRGIIEHYNPMSHYNEGMSPRQFVEFIAEDIHYRS